MFWTLVTLFFMLFFGGIIAYAYVDEYLARRKERKEDSLETHIQDALKLIK